MSAGLAFQLLSCVACPLTLPQSKCWNAPGTQKARAGRLYCRVTHRVVCLLRLGVCPCGLLAACSTEWALARIFFVPVVHGPDCRLTISWRVRVRESGCVLCVCAPGSCTGRGSLHVQWVCVGVCWPLPAPKQLPLMKAALPPCADCWSYCKACLAWQLGALWVVGVCTAWGCVWV